MSEAAHPNAVLIANRGEIALRVARTAQLMGLRTVAVHSEDDADAPHVRRCDDAVPLPGVGPAAYLDAAAVVAAATASGATLVHPGYGFLSESAELARRCAEAGLTFVGPDADVLERLGDKGRARELADALGIATVPGTAAGSDADTIAGFVERITGEADEAFAGAIIKAAHGGGGRGMRIVRDRDAATAAYDSARSEAKAAFGRDEVYVEALLRDPRHVEVQVIGDGTGAVTHLHDRDCSMQRRHQKLIEIAPASAVAPRIREEIAAAAVRMLSSLSYRGLATVEFLVAGDSWFFMEVNPRIQVEHTVTEEVLGRDLVRDQIDVCTGRTLTEIGLEQRQVPEPAGHAVQIRINAEKMGRQGQPLPQAGTVGGVTWPSGRGVRIDSAAGPGYVINPRFDSLLAKIIVHDAASDLPGILRFADAVLAQTVIAGVPTNLGFQRAILASKGMRGAASTQYVDRHGKDLAQRAADLEPAADRPATSAAPEAAAPAVPVPEGAEPLAAPMSGVITAVEVAEGDTVFAGQTVVLIESMKMQHVVAAPSGGRIVSITVREGTVVDAGAPVGHLDASVAVDGDDAVTSELDLDRIRADLANVHARKRLLLDEARPDAVRKRHEHGNRTARENVDALCDDGTFVEYGGFAVAAQRRRRHLDDLIHNTPADGMITGVGRVNGRMFPEDRAKCAVLAYDYTVLAGTQGFFNHHKTDRVLEVAYRNELPVVFFAEGGGGRPGDLDPPKAGGLVTHTWTALGKLSGRVPLIGVVAGRCFAGNAAILGCCDVIIATEDSNIGMAGPAMIEGGGLGVYAPTEIGPIGVQVANGVVDIAVRDETEAVAAARRYLSYFQGDVAEFQTHDQRELRHVVPENRKRAYDVRRAVELVADVDSVLELRPGFGTTVLTALARIEGRAVGIMASNPAVLGGAIDSDGADKGARFMQLCNVFGLPIVSLCDTPGFMVGPESEKTAAVRHFSRMFLAGANIDVPIAAVVLRKAYGLGAMAMVGGSLHAPRMTVSWPTGEFGGMGLEGYVRLGFRKELESIDDPQEREQRYEELLAGMYERGGAINVAMHLEVDDVIDPIDTRKALAGALVDVPKGKWVNAAHSPFVDAW
ncbi:acetyl-CoA carboxylase family protein [Cumulibacter manganitolerans]|uniref:acetyl-CoA carboxylase family protein n=1 Tax=Cumulibacter manganitolerans TaxID=1884992 RepID=UPI001297435F|nr:carboxyl transferase domain-containing protein [Cumulibacter manganitolerans]